MVIRLYTEHKLVSVGQGVTLTEKQCHYLYHVMRCHEGDAVLLFDGENGEYQAEISVLSAKKGEAVLQKKTKEFSLSPGIWLLFAPLKKDNTDMVVQKATELGVRRIVPVLTAYTNSDKVRIERFCAQSIEAAEQCRRTDIPQIVAPEKLKIVLQAWNPERTLFFLNERGHGRRLADVLKEYSHKAAFLIGPEGGFSAEEEALLLSYSFVKPICLGQRILRAETAAIASLSCWQAINGDW